MSKENAQGTEAPRAPKTQAKGPSLWQRFAGMSGDAMYNAALNMTAKTIEDWIKANEVTVEHVKALVEQDAKPLIDAFVNAEEKELQTAQRFVAMIERRVMSDPVKTYGQILGIIKRRHPDIVEFIKSEEKARNWYIGQLHWIFKTLCGK